MKVFPALLIFVTLFIFTGDAQAKVLPQAGKSASAKTSAVKSAGSTIGVYPRLRADRKALTVNFTNLQNAKNVSYLLIYETSVQQEAAGGALVLGGKANDSAELLFGTCSAGVCRLHNGIKNARFEISYTSVTGKKYLKKFKIRV